MGATIIVGAIALILSVWAAHVGLSAAATQEQRTFAWRLFLITWSSVATGAGLSVGLIKLYESGLLQLPGLPPP